MSEMGVRDYDVCGECIYLSDEKTRIGFKCIHPERPFKAKAKYLSDYKYKSTAACKRIKKENK